MPRPASAVSEAGARLLEIDRALRDQGWELRFFPLDAAACDNSWFHRRRSRGIGSCTWGQLADPGAVIAIQVLTVRGKPAPH